MAATTWAIDPAHTDIQFSAKHMMVTTVRGKFAGVSGALELDEAEPVRSTGRVTIAAASLSTGVDQRDVHLRSADFLDVEHHPEITFAATSIEPVRDSHYRVAGDLTIRGTTRPFTFDVEYLGVYAGLDGGRRAGFHARGTVNREAFGLTWNVALETGGWLVGRDIRLEIDVAAVETPAAATTERAAEAA